MPKIRPIRITKKDRKEFQRLNKNVKSKVNRTKKNYGVDLKLTAASTYNVAISLPSC